MLRNEIEALDDRCDLHAKQLARIEGRVNQARQTKQAPPDPDAPPDPKVDPDGWKAWQNRELMKRRTA